MDWKQTLRIFCNALIWTGTAAALFLLWYLRADLLVAFAAVLAAIMLRVLTELICRGTGLSDGLGLAFAVLILLFLGVGTVWLFGTQIYAQFGIMVDRMGVADRWLTHVLSHHGIGNQSLLRQGISLLRNAVMNILPQGIAVLESVIIIIITAIYLAAQPAIYRRGFVQLFGRGLRSDISEGVERMGTSLKLWLLAQFLLMLMVGLLSFAVAEFIGLPGAVALGLIGGLTEIVPYIGPFIGGIPAVLVALTLGIWPAVWVVGSYIGIHFVEGYLIAPMLERYFIRIPPALVLIGILVSQTIFGFAGILIAAPLTATLFVAIKIFYIQDALHEVTEVPQHSPL